MIPLALLLLLASPARAADAPDVRGGVVSTADSELARKMKDMLKEDPSVADALAQRLLKSSLGAQMSQKKDYGSALEEVRAWIVENPADAAFLAVGFSRDDAARNHEFEDSLYNRVSRFFALNPESDKGIIGRLKAAGRESQFLSKQKDMDDDERRELLQKMFEGNSGAQGRVKSKGEGKEGGGKPEDPPHGTSYAGDALYDRLHAGNPTGYSPQVQALQSELNRLAVPGAPKLIETGKLDAATLRHPYYALARDAGTLDATWRAQRAWWNAKALGEEKRWSPAQLQDPKVQDALARRAAGRAVPDSFERRRRALERLNASIAAFEKAAQRAASPRAITKGLLEELSELRRDAARWVSITALEEDAARYEQLKDFYSPALVAAVRRCPQPAEQKDRFLTRGVELQGKLDATMNLARQAGDLLRRDTDPSTLAAAAALVKAERASGRALGECVTRYTDVPQMCAAAQGAGSGLRARLEALAARFLPNTGFGRRLRERVRARRELDGAFQRIVVTGFPD
ncbi:MAG: hypothetical protein WC969_08430 [Elusimicrobiota bacterium]|jgi:hypothetical protein